MCTEKPNKSGRMRLIGIVGFGINRKLSLKPVGPATKKVRFKDTLQVQKKFCDIMGNFL